MEIFKFQKSLHSSDKKTSVLVYNEDRSVTSELSFVPEELERMFSHAEQL